MAYYDPDHLVKQWAQRMEYRTGMTSSEIMRYYDCLNVYTILQGPAQGNTQEVRKEYKARRDWCKETLPEGRYQYWRKHGMKYSYVIVSFRNRSDAIRFRLVWGGDTVLLEDYR